MSYLIRQQNESDFKSAVLFLNTHSDICYNRHTKTLNLRVAVLRATATILLQHRLADCVAAVELALAALQLLRLRLATAAARRVHARVVLQGVVMLFDHARHFTFLARSLLLTRSLLAQPF